MYRGSPRNLRMPWPPGGTQQLLNFPQPSGPQSQRTVSVHFHSPADRVLNMRPRRLGVIPANEGVAGQAQDPANDSKSAAKFMRLCYLVASLYSGIAALQMLIMAQLLHPYADVMFPGFICIMTSMMVLFILTVMGKLRKILWLSFILSALFAELVCVGVTLVLIHRTLQNVGIALVPACCLLVLCYVMGAWLPRIVLPGERIMLGLIVVFAVASMFLITMHIFTDQLVYATAYFVVLLVMLIPACVYHGQIVHSRRFRMPAFEFVLCATYVYLHFLLLFSAFYHILWVSIW